MRQLDLFPFPGAPSAQNALPAALAHPGGHAGNAPATPDQEVRTPGHCPLVTPFSAAAWPSVAVVGPDDLYYLP